MRVPRKEYARSRHQRLFEENVGKTGKDAIYELLSERFGSCIYARGSKIGEVVAAQLAQASSARPGEPGCFLQKQQPSGGIFWRAQVRGVQSDSRSLESLSPAINLAYIKKNCWNLDDPIARGKRSEVSSTTASETGGPSSSTLPPSSSVEIPMIPPAPTQIPLLTPLSTGHSIIMQSLQGLGLPSIMSMEEFDSQEPVTEEPPPPAPFPAATEEETTPAQTP
ncbi:hypothetical protein HKD37_04G010535 [Glycine soja]